MELGMGEILLILLVALLVYGGRLPQVAAAVGRSIGELRRGLRDTKDMVRGEIDELAELDPRRAVRRAWDAGPRRPRAESDPAPGGLPTEDVSGETAAVDPESQSEPAGSGGDENSQPDQTARS